LITTQKSDEKEIFQSGHNNNDTIMCKNEKTEKDYSKMWDMSQERAFIENLLSQRFNFSMVFFSLIIAGSLSTKSVDNFKIILSIGSIISWLLSLTIYRAQYKFDLIFEELLKDPNHPVTIINKLANKGESRRKLIGNTIPTICSAFLTFAAILSLIGLIKP
jgi:hypothetical protein